MLKNVIRNDFEEDGKRTSEGRLFDREIEQLFFKAVTRYVRNLLPDVGYSPSEPITWSTGDRYAQIDAIGAESVRVSLIEYHSGRSVRDDFRLQIRFIAEKLIRFLRDGVILPEVRPNLHEFPANPSPGDALEVQLIFFREGEPPRIITTIGDAGCLAPLVDTFVMVRVDGETLHGTVTDVNHTPSGAQVITANLSDLEIMEA